MIGPFFKDLDEAAKTLANAAALYRYECAQIPRLRAEIAAIRAVVVGKSTARQIADIEMRENSIVERQARMARIEARMSSIYRALAE